MIIIYTLIVYCKQGLKVKILNGRKHGRGEWMSTLENYDGWSKNILLNLGTAGEEGPLTADYIYHNDIKIVTVDNNATNMWWGVKLGPKVQIRNTL